MIKSHKLDTRPLDADPRARNAELRWHLCGIIFEGKLVGFIPRKWSLKGSS